MYYRLLQHIEAYYVVQQSNIAWLCTSWCVLQSI